MIGPKLHVNEGFYMLANAKQWAEKHIYLNNTHHAAVGFGLAIVLQHYLAGGEFLPVGVGWALIAFSVAMHAYAFTR